MKKQKKETLKNIWNKIKKPLMIFSIIGNILFLISIIVGCSNLKNNKTQCVSASYEDVELADTTWVFVDVPLQPQTSSLQTSIPVVFQSNGNTYNTFYYGKTSQSTLDYIRYGSWNNLVYNPSSGWSNSAFQTIYIVSNPTSDSLQLKKFLALNATQVLPEPEPEPEENSNVVNSIYLGDSFIPSAYVTQNGDYLFSGFAGKNTNAQTHIVHLTGLTFLSNGEMFNTISLLYSPLNAVSSRVTQDGQTLVDTTTYGDYLCCIAIKYQYIIEGTTHSNVTVCSPRRSVIVENGNNYNVFDVRPPFNVWINENYRKIDVLENDNSIQSDELLTITNKSTFDLLQITTNVSQDVMGFANVFNLLTMAFGGLASILGIAILPGITIGLLLFIPLIVIIITTVIRIIKK